MIFAMSSAMVGVECAMAIASVNGTDLHYDEAGAGAEAVVFAHGLLWSGRMFAAQVAHLAPRFRCVTFDHRGQGQSPPSATRYDMETLADDAAALIEKLGAAPCHFVGLSMGGFVGLRLALRRPELLRTLTLIDTAADPEPRAKIPRYVAMSWVVRLVGYRPLLGTVMKMMFAPAFLGDPARAAERERWSQHLLGLSEPPTRAALQAVIGRRGVEGELGRIKTPTLVLHGNEDRANAPARARRMADAIPGARWVEIARAGHSSTIEEPDAINAALDGFLG
jgi:pimeloyl-ACP methyl ester carboxylesterase